MTMRGIYPFFDVESSCCRSLRVWVSFLGGFFRCAFGDDSCGELCIRDVVVLMRLAFGDDSREKIRLRDGDGFVGVVFFDVGESS